MNKKWSYFLAASVMGAFVLMSHGAPPTTVAAGIAGAAIFLWHRSRIA